MAISQANRLLSVSTPLRENELVIKRLSAQEGISQLFHFELELLHEESDHQGPPYPIDPKKLIGQPMVVDVLQKENDAELKRYFHGICVSFSQGNRTSRWTKYQAVLVPRVWLLTQISQSRIFQQKSVADILTKVLTGFDVKYELGETYEPRNYCVQYRETDWDFISRLMEEEGIFYYFEHTSDGHKLVIADKPLSHKLCPEKSTIEFAVDRSSVELGWVGSIVTLQMDDRVRTGKYTVWDHSFELPGKNLEASQISRFDIGGNKKLEVYDYPGDYAKHFDGVEPGGGERSSDVQKVFKANVNAAKVRQQELDVNYKNFFGTSDCCTLQAGYRFELTNHQQAEFNSQYVVVSMRTEAVQSPGYVSDDPVPDPYLVSFVGISYGTATSPPFRPLRRTPKPIVHGSQTAVVVGPSGEEIHTDKYGRVKVQFHWDREGQMNDNSSCWLRVAQMWAGKNWGTMFIPRIGMEVLVDFLEGDPDRPIIVGCVYNADNMPPYTLPDHKTRATIKTNSSKRASGFNEIRFEDKAGEEQIFIHAQKNQDIRVEKDNKEWIGKDRHLFVEESQYEKVKKDKHLQVTGDQTEKIDGNVHLKVGSNKEQKIGSKFAVDSGQQIHLKAGMSVVIEAGTDVTLKAGGNFVNVGPSGVSIKGAMVLINSGGAAGTGSGANPNMPKDPLEADKDQSGQATNAPPPPTPPEAFTLLSTAAIQRAQNPAAPTVEEVMQNALASVPPSPPPAPVELPKPAPDIDTAIARVTEASDELAVQKEKLAPMIQDLRDSPFGSAVFMQAIDALNAARRDAEFGGKQAVQEALTARNRLANRNQYADPSSVLAEADKAKERLEEAREKTDAVKKQVEEAIQAGEAQIQALQGMGQQATDLARAAQSGAPFVPPPAAPPLPAPPTPTPSSYIPFTE